MGMAAHQTRRSALYAVTLLVGLSLASGCVHHPAPNLILNHSVTGERHEFPPNTALEFVFRDGSSEKGHYLGKDRVPEDSAQGDQQQNRIVVLEILRALAPSKGRLLDTINNETQFVAASRLARIDFRPKRQLELSKGALIGGVPGGLICGGGAATLISTIPGVSDGEAIAGGLIAGTLCAGVGAALGAIGATVINHLLPEPALKQLEIGDGQWEVR